MRSLYLRIVIASSITVVISLAAFMAIGQQVVGATIRRLVEGVYAVQIDEAIDAYERGGATAAADVMRRMDESLDADHYLTDAAGRDLVTGTDRSRLLSVVEDGAGPGADGDMFVYVRPSADGRYRLIATGAPPFTLWSFAPFYLLVLASILLVSWWVARSIVPPIRTISERAERFGRGELSVRVAGAPANEIGVLATTFNGMAERIESLLQSQRRLLQDVSHELRSPLARLNFSVELARTAPDREAAMDRIQTDVDVLSDLVTELIDVARSEGEPAARPHTLVDLDDVIDDVVATCTREADARQVRVVLKRSAECQVRADRDLLRRGIENVVRNGVRHTPVGAAVDVVAVARDAVVTIGVRDYGPGVPRAELARIFEPFYRVDESRDASAGGMGLGLAIARRAIEDHGGTIEAANAEPGLAVTITLPVARATPAPSA